jgi:outer membrane protein TolC
MTLRDFTTIFLLLVFLSVLPATAAEEWGAAGPPPKIPRPQAPAANTKERVNLKVQMNLPPAPAADNTDVTLAPFDVNDLPRLMGAGGPLPPIRLEASYTEPVSLQQVLQTAVENNLAIRIAKTQWKSDKYKIMTAVGNMLPSMAMGYNANQNYFTGGANSAGTFYNLIYLPVFNGGQDYFHLMRSVHEARASRFVSGGTTNDVLLDVYNKYQDLLLQRCLLNVRQKAVSVSQTQLRENEDRKAAGEGTIFEILQSQTRLAQDQQLLLRQQVSFRQAALKLLPDESILSETLLVDPKLAIGELLTTAIDSRPELKEYEQLRLAARRHIQEQLARLYPNARFYLATNTTSKSDASNSSSGAIIPAGNSLAAGLVSTGGGAGTSFTAGFILNWLLPGMGVTDLGTSLSLREQARKTTLKANEVLLQVMEEVRSSYVDMLSNKEEIVVSHRGVISAREELRVADERVRYGVGTNLELLSAQRDYFDALSRQAETIVNYRKSQARLLRDMGVISVASLIDDKRPFKIK